MLKRTGFVIVALLASACATDPAPEPAAPVASPAAPPAPAPLAAFTPALNVANASVWRAEERLLPQQPILALIAEGGNINAPVGLVFTCNPDNGQITGRLPRQPADRAGKEATFKIKIGSAAAEETDGKFQVNSRTQDADFVFTLPSAKLTQFARADVVLVETDTGEAQWAFVKDPAASPRAKYVASLKDMPGQAQQYLVFCNPK